MKIVKFFYELDCSPRRVPWHEFYVHVCISRARHKNKKAHQSRKKIIQLFRDYCLALNFFFRSHWMNEREAKRTGRDKKELTNFFVCLRFLIPLRKRFDKNDKFPSYLNLSPHKLHHKVIMMRKLINFQSTWCCWHKAWYMNGTLRHIDWLFSHQELTFVSRNCLFC